METFSQQYTGNSPLAKAVAAQFDYSTAIIRQLSIENDTLRADRQEALEIFCLTAQLMSGWMHDESWGAHDQSIYDRMIKLQLKWDSEQNLDNKS